MNDSETFLKRLSAEHAIKRALQQYCRGVDRRDFDLVRSVYHTDAMDSHGPYNGDIDGLIQWMTRRHEGVAQSMHLLGNCLIDWHTDTVALVETYCVTYQRLKPSGDASTSDVGLTVGGSGQQTQVRCRYLDRFEQREGTWKIAKRVVAYESLLLEDSPEGSPFAPAMQLATRGKDDPLYSLLN
ncbi:MAG: nuclear transport factor 2 family protein [Alcaligenaceae bacterium]|nr:nuclear transport factor 2 family protein [Alcaligenaceae bacterium]